MFANYYLENICSVWCNCISIACWRFHLNCIAHVLLLVCRSLEFEPQMIYQQNVAPAGIRPPHYMKHQEQYDKNIAGSTPELGTRQLSAEFFGQRVRRKSETCV